MKFLLFFIVLSANLLVLFGLIVSILSAKTRIWPPPRMRSWQFWVTWFLVYTGMIGVLLVGILDWETLGYVHWFRYLLGGSLILFAVPFTIWAVRTLGLHQSSGLKGMLITGGPYRYTRNPQYVACILLYVGVILITSSFMAFITGMLVILCFVLAPLSEEPWLLQQFGKRYEEYCREVPRFIGFRSLRSRKRHENLVG